MSETRRDDVVLWIVIGYCLLTPVILVTIWTFGNKYFPPMLLAILLGIATAALTYRYLGGTAGSEFKMGVLKVAGSAALLLGTAYLANQGLSSQMNVDNCQNKLADARHREESENKAKEQMKAELDKIKADLDNSKKNSDDAIYINISKLNPSSDLGIKLIKLSKNKLGPFSDVETFTAIKATVNGGIAGKNGFYACSDLQLADRTVRLKSETTDRPTEQSRSVPSKQTGTIGVTECAKKPRKFDMQINCEAGLILFPEQISGCGEDNQVKWKIPGGDRIFSINIEIMSTSA